MAYCYCRAKLNIPAVSATFSAKFSYFLINSGWTHKKCEYSFNFAGPSYLLISYSVSSSVMTDPRPGCSQPSPATITSDPNFYPRTAAAAAAAAAGPRAAPQRRTSDLGRPRLRSAALYKGWVCRLLMADKLEICIITARTSAQTLAGHHRSPVQIILGSDVSHTIFMAVLYI